MKIHLDTIMAYNVLGNVSSWLISDICFLCSVSYNLMTGENVSNDSETFFQGEQRR